jgi:hypothetical protein
MRDMGVRDVLIYCARIQLQCPPMLGRMMLRLSI